MFVYMLLVIQLLVLACFFRLSKFVEYENHIKIVFHSKTKSRSTMVAAFTPSTATRCAYHVAMSNDRVAYVFGVKLANMRTSEQANNRKQLEKRNHHCRQPK